MDGVTEMGRSIPSNSMIIEEEIRRVRKLKRKMDRRYWPIIDMIIMEMRNNRNVMYILNSPEDILLLPYIIAVKILAKKIYNLEN